MDDRIVMTAEDMDRAVVRLGQEVIRGSPAPSELVLVGIQRRGAVLARRLADAIVEQGHGSIPVGTLDISLYRDDLTELAAYPIVRPTELPFDVSGRTVLLVDDVLFTGRTIRAALAALADHGRSRAIRLVVLVDRGHRELPIKADHVGRNLPTAREEHVHVHVAEVDGADAVTLGRRPSPSRTVPEGAEA